jgi:hypothetical protein
MMPIKLMVSNPGEWQHYRIDVGQFFTGQMEHLTFIQDQDDPNGPQQSNSFFSNIRIYEASPPAVVPPPVTGDVSTTALVTHFTFDQPAGSIAVDGAPFASQGQEDPGRLQNGAAFVDTGTALQGAVQLDGVDDYVTVQDSSDINDLVPLVSARFLPGSKLMTQRWPVRSKSFSRRGDTTRGSTSMLMMAISTPELGGMTISAHSYLPMPSVQILGTM